MSLESPWIGIGPGNWIFNYTKYGISDFETFKYYGLLMQRPHNDLLWVWAELGIVGLLILAVFFIRVLKGSLKPPFYTAKNLFICCIFSFIPIVLFSFPKERVEHIFLFFTLIAVASFLSDKKKVVVFKKGARYVFAIILIPSFVLLYYRSVGDVYAKKIPLTINSGDFDKTILYARKSESFFYQHTPIGLPIASNQAYVYSKRDEFDSALFYSRKAYFEAPFNYQVLTNFGAALNAKKQFSLAEKVLLEAHRINNWYDGAIFNLAFVYYNQGNYKKAKIWIDKVSYKSQKTNYFSGLIHKKLKKTAE